MSRTRSSLKNFIWSTVSMLVSTVLNFILRTVLVKTLGSVYLGVNGLFSNVLGMLSLAELGIGSAIAFNLYKPLAENDTKKIKALINFYCTAYRIVAMVVLLVGVALIPFLPKIAKGSEGVGHLTFIYCVFIFNSVSSYLIAYKTTIISADQKNYLLININIVVNVLTMGFQILELFFFKDYIGYLLISSVIGLLKNIYLNYYTIKKYPYLKGRNSERLSKEEKSGIFTKIKALMLHKVGEVVIFQTDDIITSSVINIEMVGLVSNYNLIIYAVKHLISTFFTAILPSFGNLIATSKKEYQYSVFRKMFFLGYWMNSFTAICLYFLSTPFIKLWLGEEFTIPYGVVLLLSVNYYMQVMRTPVSTVKTAAGIFEPDKLSPIIEGIVNLVVSVIFAKKFGIVGVYIGTFVSAFVPVIWSPIVTFKNVFNLSATVFFKEYLSKAGLLVVICLCMHGIFKAVTLENNILNFVFMCFVCLIVPNLFILAVYGKSEEFKYVINLLKKTLSNLKQKFSR